MAVTLTKQFLDVGIVSTDAEAAHRFYGEALGLPLVGEIEIPGHGLVRRYGVGDSTLRVFLPIQEPAFKGSRDGFASQTGIRYLTLHVSNLDEATEAVAAAGFKVAVPVRDLRPGVRVSQVEDSEGNAVELMEES